MNLSVILIARDESANLKACIDSVATADECIVAEYGSQDDTLQVASDAGATVIVTADWPGFGPQKNRALQAARGDWVLSIDADERVTPALMAEIMQAIRSGDADAYEIPRLTQFCGRWIHHCGWTPDRVLRLFKRDAAVFSDDLVHEKLVMKSSTPMVRRLKNPLLHYSYPTPAHYWRKLERYSHDWAVQRHARGQTTTMTRAALSGCTAFLRSYVFRLGFLDGAMGFAVCTMQAQSAFGKYFELYCLERQNEKS
ncbi:MAG: glycosyltransferase family 2 protein [Comamonadaceae bacterium]|nr:MAG: glycosyltransferase family 2 protein [Comamonadaceae bacterium]